MQRSLKICLSLIFSIFMLASPFAIGFSYQNLQTTENSNEANVPSDLHSAEEKQEEVQVWTEPTCKTFEDYFTDKGITAATITEEDFYGSGTMADPYVINSSNGMWYFRNTALCRTNFVDKYVELGCDIILNEEIYDENGYIQGGDGVVYSWTEDSSSWFKNFYFEGNGFTISGLYFNDDEKNFVSLFGAGNPKRVTNLIMSNYYIVAEQYAAAVAYSVREIDNCITKDGYIYANTVAAGFVAGCSSIKNSTNFSKVSVAGRMAGGIVASWSHTAVMEITNCKNYGEISAGTGYVGGISGNPSGILAFKNCVNYGILRGDGEIGGICCADYNIGTKTFTNCVNYGDIYVVAAGSYVGGIVARSTQKTEISGCKQYGGFINTTGGGMYAGGIIGMVNQGAIVTVSNCVVKSSQMDSENESLFGRLGDATLYASNISAVIETNAKYVGIFTYFKDARCELRNINLEINTQDANPYFYFSIHTIGDNKIFIKKAIIKTNVSQYVQLRTWINQQIDSFILNNKYIGDDFSELFVNWKTGKIGLGRDKVNMFQSKVTKEWLDENGYQELTI